MMSEKRRCNWAGSDPLYVAYHDEEWGIPEHDEHRLFEMLILEGAQAGLSWLTILKKRENYRRAFAGFDPARVARFDRRKVESLLRDEGIVRNRLKVESSVTNARAYLQIQDEFGGFDPFIWRFIGGKPRINAWNTIERVPATTSESDAMGKELKRRGMKFVGSTICYAFMQAVGMVNDHTTDCAWYARASRRRRRSG
jgi:DNA-3-methyladenine glycosylase I